MSVNILILCHCFRLSNKIEFRSLHDLRKILYNFSTGSLLPGDLFAASPSTLLFVDKNKLPNKVYWLDCSGTEPKLTGKKINTTLNFIWDTCYIPDEKKPLLVGCKNESVFAFDVVSNKVEWKTQVCGCSVTTDGHNVLTRAGNEIKLLSLSDGKGLGCLIRDGDQDLGELDEVRWCNATSSLVVAHWVINEYYISTIQFE